MMNLRSMTAADYFDKMLWKYARIDNDNDDNEDCEKETEEELEEEEQGNPDEEYYAHEDEGSLCS